MESVVLKLPYDDMAKLIYTMLRENDLYVVDDELYSDGLQLFTLDECVQFCRRIGKLPHEIKAARARFYFMKKLASIESEEKQIAFMEDILKKALDKISTKGGESL